MTSAHTFRSDNEAMNYAVSNNSDITMTAYGGGTLGSQDILYENSTTGSAVVVKTPFWKITGSYYNHKYFMSGVEAYGDAAFAMRLIVSKLNYSALFPAAYSWEINGSAEAGGAISISPLGLLFVLRGQNAGSARNFKSRGIGLALGAPGASTQLIKYRYHYFGNIKNFNLENTFYSRSWDFEFSAGDFGFVAGANISIMFNNEYPGEFLVGVGSHAGLGTLGISGTGTMQETNWW